MHLPFLGASRAPAFPKRLTWLGSKPLTMASLAGKAVLVHFWTSSCVNCLRSLRHLVRWQAAYGRKGFVIVGVHAPEFAFERDEAVVGRVIDEHGIAYSVVLDNKYDVWNAYANRSRPRMFLVSGDGKIIYDHDGEDGYAETEHAIQAELTRLGKKNLPPVLDDAEPEVAFRATPEVYLGYLRGSLGNGQDVLPDTEHAFTDVPVHADDVPYLHGHWRITKEYVEHARQLSVPTEYIAIKYSGFSGGAVLGADGAVRVEISLDDQPIPASMRGADVVERGGKTWATVHEYRLYSLIRADVYHRGVLKLGVAGAGFRCFAMSFGSCKDE